jgi:hypothetical protein
MNIKSSVQKVLDRYDHLRYKENVVIGNRKYCWCSVPVPLGYPKQSQTHPAIVYSPQKWNGYSFWLATTPYPNEDIKYENPCIYKSNDHKDFQPIKNNPVLEYPGNLAYNSDPELFMYNDKLYLINRENENSNYLREIKLMSSQNGEEWSVPETIYTSNDENRQLLSPSYIKKGDKHLIYFLNGDAGVGKHGTCTGIEISETEDLTSGFKLSASGAFINKDEVKVEPWHFDLFEYNNLLYMILCGRDRARKTFRNPMYTYLAVSEDYINFRIYSKPVIRHLKSYRPSAYIDNNILHLYFSVIGDFMKDNSDRNIGYTSIPFEELLNELKE